MKAKIFQWGSLVDSEEAGGLNAPTLAANEMETWMRESGLTREQVVAVTTNMEVEDGIMTYAILVVYDPMTQSDKWSAMATASQAER